MVLPCPALLGPKETTRLASVVGNGRKTDLLRIRGISGDSQAKCPQNKVSNQIVFVYSGKEGTYQAEPPKNNLTEVWTAVVGPGLT